MLTTPAPTAVVTPSQPDGVSAGVAEAFATAAGPSAVRVSIEVAVSAGTAAIGAEVGGAVVGGVEVGAAVGLTDVVDGKVCAKGPADGVDSTDTGIAPVAAISPADPIVLTTNTAATNRLSGNLFTRRTPNAPQDTPPVAGCDRTVQRLVKLRYRSDDHQ
jgi:hypothetical protein